MSSVANTVWKTVKPHVPLIRFRKGKMDQLVRGMEAIQAAVTPPVTAAPAAAKPQVVLEEWQVPLRYRRERLTEEEIEYINRGGPA
ncbi:alpha-ketoglutarate dehydrogenase component 4 isoform X2 [Oratosquilla oratoria]|uniref:alpha-ketoglutarate dehydrogenase component 4 isoform X2 n=1 Tax=Oratosquilla oratoria TaxID=337810 RepID=UPI003F75B62B